MKLNQSQMARLISHLEQFVSEHKRERIENALQQRTREITLVLEDVYHPHNASAVLRSCECFGLQDIHIIENRNTFYPNPDVELGAAKWLTLHRYPSEDETDQTARCLNYLKREGYTIAATSPSAKAIPVSEVSVQSPLAICFGNEEEGVSPTVHSYADMHVTVPIYGFTQSFNLSVSAALCLYDLCARLRRERGDWALSEKEQLEVRLAWLKACVRNADKIIEYFETTFK